MTLYYVDVKFKTIQTTIMTDKRFLTVKEVADILRVSERSIMRYIESGRLKASKIGQWRISEDDLGNFIVANKNI